MSRYSDNDIARYSTSLSFLSEGQGALLKVGSNSILSVSGGIYGLPQIGAQDLPLPVVFASDSSVPITSVREISNTLLTSLNLIEERTFQESQILDVSQYSSFTVEIQNNSLENTPANGKCAIFLSNDRQSWSQLTELSFVSSYNYKGFVSEMLNISFNYLKLQWIPQGESNLGNSGTKITISLCLLPRRL